MIARAKETLDRTDLKYSVKLALHYCGVLKGASRNRDLRIVSQNLIRLLDGTNLRNDICELNRLCGRACRLTGHHEEAVKHFTASLDQSAGKLPDESRIYALVEMSDSLKLTGDIDGATKSAQEALTLSKPDSLSQHQAETKLLMLESDSLVKLKIKEKNARAKGWIGHANDLLLVIQADTKEFTEKIQCFDTVLESEADNEWNSYRAIVGKSMLLVRCNKTKMLSNKDRVRLQLAYNYCYSQRINLFDRCHEAIWGIIEAEGRYQQLYRLFLHSSFIWRIRGDVETETRYFEKLHSMKTEIDDNKNTIFIEISYFTKRSKVLLARLASLSKCSH
jgi:hypothetical protein